MPVWEAEDTEVVKVAPDGVVTEEEVIVTPEGVVVIAVVTSGVEVTTDV